MTRPSLAEDATPEAFADAMLLCQGYGPACSDAHECMRDGWCFSDDAKGYKAAHDKLEALYRIGRGFRYARVVGDGPQCDAAFAGVIGQMKKGKRIWTSQF